MQKHEDQNSLPFIDEDIEPNHYNLKIIESYRNNNRNIEIHNDSSDETVNTKSLSPVAPLAEETEISDSKCSDSQEEDVCRHVKRFPAKKTEMKLIIKGLNSTVSIQGLDNKSCIMFKRKHEKHEAHKIVRHLQRKEKRSNNLRQGTENSQPLGKSKKGKWKLITKSLISKSAMFERRELDERYPKYVLLKNEDETIDVKENSPKMFAFSKRNSEAKKRKDALEIKSDFNLKKSFNNKTNPVVPIEEIIAKTKKNESKNQATEPQQKLPLAERNQDEPKKSKAKRKENRGSFAVEKPPNFSVPLMNTSNKVLNTSKFSVPQTQVFNEIQDIFENTLKLGSENQSPVHCCSSDRKDPLRFLPENSCPPMGAKFFQYSCSDPYCRLSMGEPPVYVPVYTPYKRPNTQTSEHKPDGSEPNHLSQHQEEREVNFQHLPFEILSSLFPRVVIMKTFENEATGEENDVNEMMKNFQEEDKNEKNPYANEEITENSNSGDTLEIPEQNLSLKSKMVSDKDKFEAEVNTVFTKNETSTSDEEHKAKSDDSEATEYLHFSAIGNSQDTLSNGDVPMWLQAQHWGYFPKHTDPMPLTKKIPCKVSPKHKKSETTRECENEFHANESEKPTITWETSTENKKATETAETKIKGITERFDEISKNVSLTSIGYKMYDNMTKLSLKREKETQEDSGCGCNGTKKTPCNITLESNNGMVKVSVPENDINLQIINPEGRSIQIGLSNADREGGRKKTARKSDLWFSDDCKKETVLHRREEPDTFGQGTQKFQVSLPDNKEIKMVIKMDEEEQRETKVKANLTKDIKVGTDDFDLAGGDFLCTFETNYKNLSPRTEQLLRNLQEKLELSEKERKFLSEKVNEKTTDQKFQKAILPGVFLVKQISPRLTTQPKKLLETSALATRKKELELKNETIRPREYYCKECLATMRMFEDENPSVKSMVDKFETIIQLESY